MGKLFIIGLLSLGISYYTTAQNAQVPLTKSQKEMKSIEEINSIPIEYWKSGIIFDGHKITLPCKVTDLQELGWKLEEQEFANFLMPRNARTNPRISYKGNKFLTTFIANPYYATDTAVAVKDCILYGLGTEATYNDDVPDFALYKEVISKITTEEDFLKICKKNNHNVILEKPKKEIPYRKYGFTFDDEGSYLTVGIAKSGKYKGKIAFFELTMYYESDKIPD